MLHLGYTKLQNSFYDYIDINQDLFGLRNRIVLRGLKVSRSKK